MNRTSKGLAAVAIVLVCIVCFAYYRSSRSETGTVKIGAALGLTGECGNYGEGELKAAQLAVAEANQNGGIAGRKIDLIVEDTQCSPKDSVNAMQKLVQVDNVEAVVGL